MASTYNRRPRFVDTPTSKAIATSYFHQNEWKGICEDKNTFGVDQNTFSECENVYVDRDNVLANRPGINDEKLNDFNDTDFGLSCKIYNTKSYIIYIYDNGNNIVAKIIDVDKSQIAAHDLTLPVGFSDTELYFYEIGNKLFAFGNIGIYRLKVLESSYSLESALDNVYIPLATDVRNLLAKNNYMIDTTLSYNDAIDIPNNPELYDSPSLQITTDTGADIIIDDVVTNWPYSVSKLSKTILKNASQLTSSESSPKYENLYYIDGDIYTNGGTQKSLTITTASSNSNDYAFMLEWFLYDKDGVSVSGSNTSPTAIGVFTIPNPGTNGYIKNYWYKIDYYKSKLGVIYVAIGFTTTEQKRGLLVCELDYSNWTIPTPFVPFEFTEVSTMSFFDLAEGIELSMTDDSKFVPYCFYYDKNNELKSIACSASAVTVLNIRIYTNRVISLYPSFMSETAHFALAADAAYIFPVNSESNVQKLLNYTYIGRQESEGYIWTAVNSSNSSSVFCEFLTEQNVVYKLINDARLLSTVIDEDSDEGIFLYKRGYYDNSKNIITKISLIHNYDADDVTLTVVDEYQSVYINNATDRPYVSYCSLFEYSNPDEPFGTLLLNNTETLVDIYYDGTNIILLTETGKLITNLQNDQANITYKLYSSPNTEYTGKDYVPTLIRPIGSNSFLYFVNDTSYVLLVRYNNDLLKLYLPEGKENKYYDTVIDAEQTSDKSLAVIGNNVLYSVVDTEQVDDKQLPVFQYIQSKLNLRVIEDSDSIIAYNSSTLLMPTYNGIAAVNYSELISVEEQTVKYITDNIMTHWFRFVATEGNGRLRTCNHNYYLFVYHTLRNDLYMFDYRTNTWWYWTFDKHIKLLHTIGLQLFVIFEDNTLHYFDDKILDAQWFISSQKLFLGNNTNYKQIRRFTVHTIGEHSEFPSKELADNIMDLRFYCYRKRMHSIQELEDRDDVYNFNVDFVRTYVIRVNYPKVYEFQYRLSSNPITLRPLQLTGITIEYKVGGKVR